MAVTQKQILAIVSTAGGTLIKTWPSIGFQGFTKSINVGLGECVLTLPYAIDFESSELNIGNDVEIRISDEDTQAATAGRKDRTIYRGYISMVEREANGGQQTVTVHLLGYATLLGIDVLKNSAQTTLYSFASGLAVTVGSRAGCDLGTLVQAILTRYIAETTSPKVGFVSTDIPLTGTSATYTFQQMMYQDAIEACRKLAPSGTFWYCGETGLLKFGQKPTTPTHRFVFGKHFNDIKLTNSLENIRNAILVWNGKPIGSGGVYYHFEDAPSITQYGRRAISVSDYGITDSTTAGLLGAKWIAEAKDATVTLQATIVDDNGSDTFGYDIESIQPGDTCTIAGFSVTLGQMFRDNALITDVQYDLDKAIITVEIVKSGLTDIQNDSAKSLSAVQGGGLGVPESYT